MDLSLLLVFLGTSIAIGCGGLALAQALSRSRRRARQRIEKVQRRWRGGGLPVPSVGGGNSVRKVEARSLPVIDRLARRLMPNQEVLKARLARTGRDIPVASYLLACLGGAVISGTLIVLLFKLPPVLGLFAGVILGLGLPHFAIGRMAAARLKKFIGVFPDAIDLMVRGLKSGLTVTESINAVGREMAGPVGEEFRRVADSIRFGETMEQALWSTAGRLDIPEFKFFVISLAIQRETGGNLGETLGNLSDILRRRRQMRMKIKAMSSEARASAMILGALPFIMFGLLMLLNFDYEMMLFTDPRGLLMVGGGLLVLTMGIAVMAKMVRFEI